MSPTVQGPASLYSDSLFTYWGWIQTFGRRSQPPAEAGNAQTIRRPWRSRLSSSGATQPPGVHHPGEYSGRSRHKPRHRRDK